MHEDSNSSGVVTELARRTEAVAAAARDAVADLDLSAIDSEVEAELVESIRDRLDGVNDECQRIHGILDRVATMIGVDLSAAEGGESDDGGAVTAAGDTADESGPPMPVAYPGTGQTELAEPPSEGIRLLATQMALSGESVADIERRLRSDFGVENAHLVVGELFGTHRPERE